MIRILGPSSVASRSIFNRPRAGEGPLPPSGTIGEDRFKELKVPGTYWWKEENKDGKRMHVLFDTGETTIAGRGRSGDNILKVAEACGAIRPNEDFCFEGTCELCLVEGKGLEETSWKADPTSALHHLSNDKNGVCLGKDVVRSCLTPLPDDSGDVTIKVLGEDEVWGEGVV